MGKQIAIGVDYENNAETWWDAARTQARRERDLYPETERELPASCGAILENADEVTVSTKDAATFRAWASQLPGWATGPDHAPHPVTFTEVD